MKRFLLYSFAYLASILLLSNASYGQTITTGGGPLTALTTTYGTASSNTTFTAAGASLTADIAITAPAGFEVSVSSGSGFSSSISLTPSAGTVSTTTIYVRLAGNTNQGSYSGNVVLTSTGATTQNVATVASTVNRKALTMTGLTVPASKIYNGNDLAVVSGTPTLQTAIGIGTGTPLDGKPYEATVSITGTPVGTYNSKDVGAGTSVTFSGLSLTGTGSGNYTLTIQSPAGATITAKALTITGATVANKEYDGTATATLGGSPALSGVETGDAANVTLNSGSASGSFANANVGTAKPVTTTGYSISGTASGNYSLTQPTLAADITAKPLTITMTSTKVYDGNTAATLTPTLVGVLAGDVANVTLDASGITSSTFSTAAVGTGKAITIVGTYAIAGTAAGNYSLTQPTGVTGDITARPLTITITSTKVYDGNTAATLTPTLVGVLAGDVANVTLDASGITSSTFSTAAVGTGKAITILGTYSIAGTAAGNYSLTQPTGVTGDITAKPLTISGASANNKVYDGNTTATLGGSPALSGVLAGDAANVTLNSGSASGSFANANVGTAKPVTTTGYSISGTASGNYSLTQPTLAADITAKPLTITITSTKVYDGNTAATLTPTLVGVLAGDVANVTLDASGITSSTFSTAAVGTGKAITIVGTYSIAGTAAGNYSLTQPTGVTGDITARPLTISGASANNKVYDGNTTATLGGGTSLSGVLAGDVANVTLDGSGASGVFSTAAVGTGKSVTISGYIITGSAAGNYSLSQPTGVIANITAKPLTITGASANNKVYDGNTTATLGGSPALSGVLAGDVANVTLNSGLASGSFANANVGTAKPVTTTGYSISGTASGNYSLTQPTLAADITAKPLTITITSTKVYDGNTAATLTPTLVGVLAGDVANVTLDASGITSSTFSTAAVGTGKAITITGTYAIAGTAAGNYSLTQPTGVTGDVTAKALTITGATVANKVYDGTTTATLGGTPTLVGVVGSEDVTIAASPTATFNNKNVGTAKPVTSVYALAGTATLTNYTLTQPTLSANITKAILTVTGVNANKIYNGTITTPTITGATLSGIIGSDVVTLNTSGVTLATFASKDVGSGISITLTGSYALAGADAGNYDVTQPTGLTATITPKELTMSGLSVPTSKVYDGTTAAVVTGGPGNLQATSAPGAGTTSDGKPYSVDAVSLTGTAVGTYNTKDVATANTVAFSGVSLTGTGSGNYTLTIQSNSTASITRKALTMSGLSVPTSKIYDATTSAVVSGSPGNLQATSAPGGGTTSDGKPYSVDAVSLTGTAVGTYNSKDVATANTVAYSGVSLTGTGSGNYTLTIQSNSAATITTKSISIVGLTANNKVRDGNTTATLTGTAAFQTAQTPGTGTTADQKPYTGDVITVTGSPTATFANTGPGAGIAVTVTGYTIGGAQSGNYSPVQPAGLSAIIYGVTTTVTAGATPVATISSLSTAEEGAGVLNFNFVVTDAGDDGTATSFTGLVINAGANNQITPWSTAIQGVRITDGTNSQTANITIGVNTLTITSINPATLGNVSNGTSKTYSLKIWLNSNLGALQSTIDNKQFDFNVTTASFTTGVGSQIAASQSQSSGTGRNVVTVVSTSLAFTTQPSPTTHLVLTNFTTRAVVKAQDANGNLDLDFTGVGKNVTLTNAAGVAMNPGNTTSITLTPVAGVIDFNTLLPNLQYTDANAGSFNGTLTLTGGGINSNAGAGFVACSPITVNYSNATTISGGSGIANISSIATGDINVFSFTVTDDGGAGGDGAATKISSLKFTPNGSNQFGNFQDLIASAKLTSGANSQTITSTLSASGVINTTDLTFSSIPNATGNLGNVADDSPKIFTLSITLKTPLLGGSLPSTADNLKLVLDIIRNPNITLNATGSTIPTGQSANSGTSNGAFQVFATKLEFTTQPQASYLVNVPLADPGQVSPPVVEALDVRNNRDLDYVAPVTTTTSVVTQSNQPTIFRSNVPVGNGGIITTVAGQAFGFGDMRFTSIGVGAAITVTSTTPNANSVVPTAAVSSLFEVKVGSASTIGSPATIGPVPSTAFTAAAGGGSTGAAQVFRFVVTDDAAAPNDGNPTLVRQITFRQNASAAINSTGLADWRHAIAGAVLSDGTNTLTLDFSSASDVTRIGTITASTGSTTVTGTGTSFTTDLSVGTIIKNSGGTTIGTVATITSNTSLTLAANASVAVTNGAYRASPLTAKSIIFSAIPFASGQLGFISDSPTFGTSSKTYTLSIWLKTTLTAPLPITIDGLNFGFDVQTTADVLTDANGTALASGTAVATSGNTVNVVASKINYLTLPFTSVPSLPFPNSRSIYDPFGGTIGAEAVDINGNRDLNYTGTISGFAVANSLAFTNNPNGQAFTAGTFTFDTNFQYQTTGSTQNADGSITMTGAGPITGTSTAINIFSSTDSYVYFDPTFGAQVYSNIVNQQASSLPNPANATVEKLAQLILTDGEVSRTGTINASTASTTVTGIGTSFTTELSVGTLIKNSAGAVIGTVASIASNTSLTLSASAAVAVSSGSYRANVDADNAFTRISSITFTLTGAGTSDLRTLALYDNSGNKVSSDQPASGSVTFSGLTIQAADGGINTFSIRGTFRETIGADRDPVTFKVSSVTWSAGSRFFNFTNPLFIGGINGGSTSPSNQINVVATSLDFVTQPSIFAGVDEDINASTGYSTGIVHARDKFANLDTDFNFPYVLSAAAGAVRNPATATFTNGVLDLVGMKYNTWGIGTLTVTSNSLTSANSLSVNSKPCVPINVISVSAIKVISGQPASASLRGGNVNTTIFGVFLKPNHFVSDQPLLKSLTFEFSTPYRTATRTTFKNFKVFEKRADSLRVSAVNVSAFATLTEIESVSGSGNFDRVKVAFTSDRPLYPDGSSPATVTYFLETDIDVTASNNTPKITPRLVDLGQGDNRIEITQGSAKVSVTGREYSFASTRPPLLVGASCVPPTGTLNVSAGITSIGLTFDVPVVTFDKVAKLYYYNTNQLVATLEATNGIFDSGIEIINTPPVKTMNFKIPTGVVLRPDSVYYVTLAQGKYDPITKIGEGLSDDQLNLYGGIAYKGIYYFKIASTKPPAMVSTDATKYEATPTFASLNASFDQKGKGYYLILPNTASPAPTATQVKLGTYGGKLSSGTFAIDQLAPNLQYFTATGSFPATGPYQVWIVAENDAPDLPRPSSGVFGSSPNFTAGATGPTFTFSQFTPTGANATPNFQLCPGSFSVVSQPIVLRENNSTGTNATWGIGTQNFNILLPTGFTFDSDYAPTIEQVGADFTIARTGTITASTSATTVTGSGTLFTTQLAPGHILKNSSGTTIGVVAAIASNTSLTLAANASVALTNGAYRSEQLPTFSFINSTLLRVTFENAGSSSDDRLIVSNMRISPSSVNSAGEIIRFGGSGLTNYGDLTRLAAIRANALAPQAFTNSYTQFNAFGSSVGINSVVTSIPDNFLDQNLNNRNVIRLIPKITPSNDYNASFFSGAGVTDDVLNLSGVTKNVAFDITMTRTDLNGCFLSQKEQYLVYDNTKIIPKLTVDVFGPKQAAANPNYKTPQDVDAPGKSAPVNKSAQTLAAKDIAGYTMEEMVLKIPKEITTFSKTPTRESQIIQGATWQAQLDNVLVQEGPTRNNANGTIERDYKWDFSPILNAKRVPGGVDKDPYVHFLATSPQGQTYYEGGSLGSVDFIGKFRNNADLLVFQPLVQRIELFVPAVPVVEVTGQSYKKPATGTKPPVYVYCEQGPSILFNGFPAASPGKSKAYYSIYDSALNTLLYDGKNPGGNVNKGFTDNANSNGTSTLVPNFGPYFVNGYKTLRVTYTYQDDNSPAIGVGEIFIQIAPNPLANFKFKSTPGVNAPNAFNDKSICSGNLIEFDAGESTVGGNSVVPTKYTYTWNFDNSKASNPPAATGVAASKPTHTFTDVRNYNVSLSMISDVGCPSIPMVLSGPQTTTPGPKVIPVKVGDIPVVDFSFKNNCVGDNIEFTDMSSTDVGSSTKARFKWEFGNGNNKVGFNPANQPNVAPNIFENFEQTPSALVVTNTYTQPNVYTVKLTTTTNVGCSNSREKQIAILPLKTATAGAEFSEFFDTDNGGWQALDLSQPIPQPGGNSSWTYNHASAIGKWSTPSYKPNERSALYSACLDLTNVPRPVISFRTDIGLATGEGLVLQYSKDNLNIFDPAKGWEVLGTTIDDISPGLDWYNAKALPSNPGIGYTNSKNASGYGWAGALGKIAPKHKVEDITGTTGLPNSRVIVRFALAALNAGGSGIKIDSIRVGSRTRTVLFENFTTTNGGANATVNANLKTEADFITKFTKDNINSTQLVNVNYFVDFLGKDPFNSDNPADPSSRALFYNVSRVPYAYLDGKHGQRNGSDLFKDWGKAAYDLQTLELANADFTPTGPQVTTVTPVGKTVEVEVYVKPTRDLPSSTRLFVGILEKSIPIAKLREKQPGAAVTTGETEFNYVLKKMLPNALGTRYPKQTFKRDVLVRLAPDGKVGGTEKFKWESEKLYTDSMSVVLFLQDSLGTVYQAELFNKLKAPELITGSEAISADQVSIYPNPTDLEFTIQLPANLAADATVLMIDQVGRTFDSGIFSAGRNAKTISTGGLAAGVYVVEIRASDGALVRKKVVVAR